MELLRRWQHLPVEKRLAIGRPTPHPAPTQLAARPWERLGSALPAAGRGNPAPPPDTLPPGRPVEFSSRRPVFIFSKEEFDVLIFTNSTPSRSPLTCISGASGFIPVGEEIRAVQYGRDAGARRRGRPVTTHIRYRRERSTTLPRKIKRI